MKRCLIAVVLLLGANCYSQIYKWVDDSGKAHFSDKPLPGATDSEVVDLAEPNTSEPLQVQRRAPTPQAQNPTHPAAAEDSEMNKICREAKKEYHKLTAGAGRITVLTEDGKAITRKRQNHIAEEFRSRMNSKGCAIGPSAKKLKL